MTIVDTSFATHLATSAFGVAAFTLGLAGPLLIADMKRLRGVARVTTRHVAVVAATGTLIHHLQLERGLSATGSAGLDDQRRQVDRMFAAWREEVGALALNGKAAEAREQALARIALLEKLRIAAKQADRNIGDILGRFSAIIGGLLDMSVALVHATARGPSARQALAYGNLLRLKEAAGRERATLAAALKTAWPATARCEEMIVAQALHLQQVLLLAAPEIAEALRRLEAGPGREIEAARIRAAGQGDRIEPQEWFATASRRIDALKSVEDSLAVLMTERASGFVRTTRRRARMARLLAGLGAAASCALGFLAL